MVPLVGFELTTYRLQGGCSTNCAKTAREYFSFEATRVFAKQNDSQVGLSRQRSVKKVLVWSALKRGLNWQGR
jgi:hypothetical protein